MGMAEEYLDMVDEQKNLKRKPIYDKQPPFASARLSIGTRVRIKPQNGAGWKDQPLPGKGECGVVTESQPRWVRVKLDSGVERTFSMRRIEVIE